MLSMSYLMLRRRRRRRLEARTVPIQPDFSDFSRFPYSLEGRYPWQKRVPAGACPRNVPPGPRRARPEDKLRADPGAGTTRI
jgi:hypothetical protein